METQSVVHSILRAYTDDSNVAEDLKNLVLGYSRSRDVSRLATCTTAFDPQLHGINEWKFLRQVSAFFRKNAVFTDRAVSAEAARVKFLDCERRCAETNVRILDSFFTPLEADMTNRISSARSYIRRVLGSFTRFCEALPGLVRVTSGASANASRRNSLPQQKLSLRPYVNSGAALTLCSIYAHYGFRARPRVCDTNRVELVPKDWKSDRTIACEPEGSLCLQLAFDTWVKRRLRRFHINLSDQTRNQRAAQEGSISNELCTVDFSSASDTLAYATVLRLLPLDWADYLCRCRSARYRGAFGQGEYAKFSSMGNGATFCLETLIFASLCYAAGSRRFLVYGDDVILEKEYFGTFQRMATFFGFQINSDKTFTDGPFRESCGGDYYLGKPVTPIYIKDISHAKASLCHLVNSLRPLGYDGSTLWQFLDSLQRDESLPIVPFNPSTTSGVWIDPFLARGLGKLVKRRISRHGPLLDYFKAYVPVTERRTFVDSRGYYLWFLQATKQVTWSTPWVPDDLRMDVTQTSSATLFAQKYQRKWVVWHQPDDDSACPYGNLRVSIGTSHKLRHRE